LEGPALQSRTQRCGKIERRSLTTSNKGARVTFFKYDLLSGDEVEVHLCRVPGGKVKRGPFSGEPVMHISGLKSRKHHKSRARAVE